MIIKEKLLEWYQFNKRDLPWRKSPNPYEIWVSEIILQQTRVNQGINYYNRFIHRFPDIKKLANAPIDDVMLIWKGLGYYSRARNMHKAAKYVVEQLNNRFPDSYVEILKMKGVGKYTAAAIASIVFHEPVPVIDGNVIRVYSRLFNVNIPVDTNEGLKKIESIAKKLIDKKNPGNFNQALMEFGALNCIPKNPNCTNCIFNDICKAYQKNKMTELPLKSKTLKIKKRYFSFFIIYCENKVFIHKRSKKDIWNSLYQFPLIESDQKSEFDKTIENEKLLHFLNTDNYELHDQSDIIIHKLTHQTIFARFYHLSVKKNFKNSDWMLKDIEEVMKMPLPKLIDQYLHSIDKFFIG